VHSGEQATWLEDVIFTGSCKDVTFCAEEESSEKDSDGRVVLKEVCV
jgi:hypothetical protein